MEGALRFWRTHVHTNLYSFAGGTNGALPTAELILADNIVYGTTEYGGSDANDGAVFSLSVPAGPPQLTITRSEANVIPENIQ